MCHLSQTYGQSKRGRCVDKRCNPDGTLRLDSSVVVEYLACIQGAWVQTPVWPLFQLQQYHSCSFLMAIPGYFDAKWGTDVWKEVFKVPIA
jgi:hypothetical protein